MNSNRWGSMIEGIKELKGFLAVLAIPAAVVVGIALPLELWRNRARTAGEIMEKRRKKEERGRG